MTATIKTDVKSTIVRTWTDIDPKVAAAFLSGGVASAVLIALHFAGIAVPSSVEVLIGVACTIVGGYLKASTRKGDLLAKVKTSGLSYAVELADAVKAAVPETAPAITSAEDILKALTPETTNLAAVTATATDPTPAEEAIQAAAEPAGGLPAPVAAPPAA